VPFQASAAHEGGTFVTTPEVDDDHGVVNVRTWVRNEYPSARLCTLRTTITDARGSRVAQITSRENIQPSSTHEFPQRLGPLERPHLWSPDSPYLYKVSTEVFDGVRLADTYSSPLGLRWFSWNHAEGRLYLNGHRLVLRGMNRHQEYPWLGDAMPRWIQQSDMLDMRQNLGMYFQRTAHYP